MPRTITITKKSTKFSRQNRRCRAEPRNHFRRPPLAHCRRRRRQKHHAEHAANHQQKQRHHEPHRPDPPPRSKRRQRPQPRRRLPPHQQPNRARQAAENHRDHQPPPRLRRLNRPRLVRQHSAPPFATENHPPSNSILPQPPDHRSPATPGRPLPVILIEALQQFLLPVLPPPRDQIRNLMNRLPEIVDLPTRHLIVIRPVPRRVRRHVNHPHPPEESPRASSRFTIPLPYAAGPPPTTNPPPPRPPSPQPPRSGRTAGARQPPTPTSAPHRLRHRVSSPTRRGSRTPLQSPLLRFQIPNLKSPFPLAFC